MRRAVSVPAVLSLALGIGVNSTIFTVVNGFLLKPLPVTDIDEVLEVFTSISEDPFNQSSYLDYVDYRDEVEAFGGLAANMTMLYSWNLETHSEALFDELADALAMDRLEFRRRNALADGVPTVTGQVFDRGVGIAPAKPPLNTVWPLPPA